MEIPSEGFPGTNQSSEIGDKKIKTLYILYANAYRLMNKRQKIWIRLIDLNFKSHIIAITEVKNKE